MFSVSGGAVLSVRVGRVSVLLSCRTGSLVAFFQLTYAPMVLQTSKATTIHGQIFFFFFGAGGGVMGRGWVIVGAGGITDAGGVTDAATGLVGTCAGCTGLGAGFGAGNTPTVPSCGADCLGLIPCHTPTVPSCMGGLTADAAVGVCTGTPFFTADRAA